MCQVGFPSGAELDTAENSTSDDGDGGEERGGEEDEPSVWVDIEGRLGLVLDVGLDVIIGGRSGGGRSNGGIAIHLFQPSLTVTFPKLLLSLSFRFDLVRSHLPFAEAIRHILYFSHDKVNSQYHKHRHTDQLEDDTRDHNVRGAIGRYGLSSGTSGLSPAYSLENEGDDIGNEEDGEVPFRSKHRVDGAEVGDSLTKEDVVVCGEEHGGHDECRDLHEEGREVEDI